MPQHPPSAPPPGGHASAPAPGPRGRPPWLIPVAALALVGAIAVGFVGFRYAYQHLIRTDPGIVICERWRAEEAVPRGQRPPADDTPQEYEQVRDEFEQSRHDDLRETGVRLADSILQLLNARGTTMEQSYRQLAQAAYLNLQESCANHGVRIVINRGVTD